MGRVETWGGAFYHALAFGFVCKFVEIYFYLTLSFSYPKQVMVGMKIQGCTDQFFGNALCTN